MNGRYILIALSLFFSLALGYNSAAQESLTDNGAVYVLNMKGAVGPAFAEYISEELEIAGSQGAQLVVIKLNTPGGLLTSTRDIVSDIIESPVPVAVWVTPSGAHAASAGTFLLYASHLAVMDEGTNIGAATPITGDGSEQYKQESTEKSEDKSEENSVDKDGKGSENKPLKQFGIFDDFTAQPNSANEAKALEDTMAFLRSIAELRDRNIQWAERSIRNAESITANEALEKEVIDFIAPTLDSLLSKANGRIIELKDGRSITLNTQNPRIIERNPDIRTQILSYITDPNIAFILMTIGLYGLILEFYNPGTMIPGTIGGICLILGLFALNVLPVNAAGIGLILLAFALVIAEIFVPSFGILGLGGIAAFLLGITIMFDTVGMTGFAINYNLFYGVALAGALLVGTIVILVKRAYSQKSPIGIESMIGEEAEVIDWTGSQGHVRLQGEQWHAKGHKDQKFKKGDMVTVTKLTKLTVTVKHKDKT